MCAAEMLQEANDNDTEWLCTLEQHRAFIRKIFHAAPPPQPASRIREEGDSRGQQGPEHLIVLSHGLDGTEKDLGYVMRTIEGVIMNSFPRSKEFFPAYVQGHATA